MKVAISLPDPVFYAAEQLASALNKPRSQLYAEAVAEYVGAHGARDITQRLNLVHAIQPSTIEPAMAAAQGRVLGDEAW